MALFLYYAYFYVIISVKGRDKFQRDRERERERERHPAAQMLQGQSAPSGAQMYFFYTCLPEIIAHVFNCIHAGFSLPQPYI